ncbi:MAG: MarR family transcriptional regulator [Proteobacteria bacterium]|nr:MAG: MarR family transcriptional regulator [Pseudomonadota bacterium]
MTMKSTGATFLIRNALLASRLSRRVGNRLGIHGISFTEFLVMDFLSGSPNKAAPRIELAEHLGMSASGVTRLLAPMEKNGLVEKVSNPRDARQSLVTLSRAGRRVCEQARVSFEEVADELLVNLSKGQQEMTIEMYGKLG